MRVLICGGGIAGLTLAFWLHHFDFEPVLIEQAAGIRHDGYGLDFYGTGNGRSLYAGESPT
jgi:2-polyprenyl-6-methoxyphenol hydroxylase-like FAD-dependent oxidoreductase